jgi:hypothetical protein
MESTSDALFHHAGGIMGIDVSAPSTLKSSPQRRQ